ncbi:carbonic anhydrase 2-like isoform X1 [Apostichopus japonicus]|uniref:carbonic anhydrase 2-like isoform X1 n=1 Tax=Stichopus japonicus TaxID=307972 RepID=UPI003AB2C300
MIVFALLTIFLLSGVDCSEEWSYAGENGPDHWADLEGSYCGGSSQSPININTKDVVLKDFEDWKLSGFSLNDENSGQASSITNNGHSLTVNLDGNYHTSGGGLTTGYKAVQFHFHWGSVDTQGSEHTVDDQMYAAEMHIVHHKDTFDDLGAAVANGDDDDLAVLGVLIEVGESNEALAEVFELAKDVPYEGNTTEIPSNNTISVADMLPKDVTRYFRYLGSLTTPTCNEVVVWTVFEDSISISADQMEILRNLHEGDAQSPEIEDNYRPVQSVNDREIAFSSAAKYSLSLLLSTLSLLVLSLQFSA